MSIIEQILSILTQLLEYTQLINLFIELLRLVGLGI